MLNVKVQHFVFFAFVAFEISRHIIVKTNKSAIIALDSTAKQNTPMKHVLAMCV